MNLHRRANQSTVTTEDVQATCEALQVFDQRCLGGEVNHFPLIVSSLFPASDDEAPRWKLDARARQAVRDAD